MASQRGCKGTVREYGSGGLFRETADTTGELAGSAGRTLAN